MSHENTIWVANEKLMLVQDLNTFYQMGFRILLLIPSIITSYISKRFSEKLLEILIQVKIHICAYQIKMPDKRKEGGSSSSATGSAEKSLGGSSAKKARVAVNTGGTVTESSRTNVESLTYDPVHFIRSHSKNNDPADIQTQVRQ